MIILRADTAAGIPLRKKSVQCVVTSIPYFRLRVYGFDSRREIGSGAKARDLTLMEYVNSVVMAFRQVHWALRDDGLVWLNVGDSSIGSGGPGNDYYKAGGNKNGRPLYSPGTKRAFGGLERMQVGGVPWRVALALQEDGWLLRVGVTWNKDKVRRGEENEKHMRRPGTSSEMIFMLAKTTEHLWYPGRLKEKGNVWTFSAKSGRREHDAPFPDELPERCILPSTDPGDVVLDPFGGSHTTAEVAERHGRRGVSLDLYAGLSEDEAFNGVAIADLSEPPPWIWTDDPDDPCSLCIQWRDPATGSGDGVSMSAEWEPYLPDGSVVPRVYREVHDDHELVGHA